MGKKQIFAMFTLIVLLFASCSGQSKSDIQLTDQAEGEGNTLSENTEQGAPSVSGQMQTPSENEVQEAENLSDDQAKDGEIICDNPYFFSPNVSSLTADITFFDVDTEGYVTIRGDLELHWLRQYENGCIAKLSFVPFDHMPSYMLNGSIWGEEYDYSDIYFYVTSDKIYRINSRVIQDGENIYAYENEKLFIDLLSSEEKIIENAELVCCPEGIESEYTGDNIGDDFITGEIGTHYEIVVSENQIAYCRQEYPAGHMEFYNSFVWENGRGLIEHKRGYRAGAMPLCIENITVNQ